MANPRPAVTPPTTEKYFELVCSVPIKIHVGPEAKLYTLPKDLLAYYSPYFAGCFHGGFQEAQEGVLRLPEERTDFFDVFIEYIGRGTPKFWPSTASSDTEDKLQSVKKMMAECFAFIRFTDAYDMGEVASAAEECLEHLLKKGGVAFLVPEELSFVAGVLHKESPTYKLLMRACIERYFGEHQKAGQVTTGFKSLMEEDDVIASGMMRELFSRNLTMCLKRQYSNGCEENIFLDWKRIVP